MMTEDNLDGVHLVKLEVPDEKEPNGLIHWQYIWPDAEGRKNICMLFSLIGKDGVEVPRKFSFIGNTKEHTAEESLNEIIASIEEQITQCCEKSSSGAVDEDILAEPRLAVVDKNPKRPMGFLAGRE